MAPTTRDGRLPEGSSQWQPRAGEGEGEGHREPAGEDACAAAGRPPWIVRQAAARVPGLPAYLPGEGGGSGAGSAAGRAFTSRAT